MSTPNVAIPQSEEPKAGVAGGGGGETLTSRGGRSTARAKLETGF